MRKTLLITLLAKTLFGQTAFNQDLKTFDQNLALGTENFYREEIKPVELPKKSPIKAWLYSSLISGGGQLYLGDRKLAGACFSTSFVGGSFALLTYKKTEISTLGLYAAISANFYSQYAAYRDAKLMNDLTGKGVYPKDSLFSLVTAPFRPSILKSPRVWGGLMGSLTAAGIVAMIADHYPVESIKINNNPFLSFPIAFQEEVYFRGTLMPIFSDFQSPRAGLAISSVLFGLAHLGNAEGMDKRGKRTYYTYSIPFLTLAGAYMGYLTQKTGSLQESIALHAWYDFTLFAFDYLTTDQVTTPKEVIATPKTFAITIPF